MKLTVRDLTGIATVLAGRSGLNRPILSPQMTTPELCSLGIGKGAVSRVMHIRPSQLAYLCSLSSEERTLLARTVVKRKPACIVVSGGETCKELIAAASAAKIPVLKTGNQPGLCRFMMEKLLPKLSLHGVLVQIFELGTLIIGESAVGKSEAALDLVLRGHKLVADDMVLLEKTDKDIYGRPTEMGADLLQIRGMGIINISALYGNSATVRTCKVGLVVELEEWRVGNQYSLVGLRERRYRVLGINLPYLKLPVKPGRNMATLIEVAARNQILKNSGMYTARDLGKKLKKRLVG